MNKSLANHRKTKWIYAMLLMFTLAACSVEPIETSNKAIDELSANNIPIQTQSTDDQDLDDAGSDNAIEQQESITSAERQPINIETMDGRILDGFFYPPRNQDAPVIVLMHWAPGTMEDWNEIALWLQNRKDELISNPSNQEKLVGYSKGQIDPWHDPSWFPLIPPEVSFGVLIFNFGGRGSSQAGPGGDGLFYDALAAMVKASTLQDINPNKISAVGASIGSDASVNSCQAFNASEEYKGTCQGAFSLSPGNYLNRDYGESVNLLRQEIPPKTVFCLAAESDGNSLNTCQTAEGDHFEVTRYEGSAHGMNLVAPNYDPNPLMRLLEFLQTVYEITLIN